MMQSTGIECTHYLQLGITKREELNGIFTFVSVEVVENPEGTSGDGSKLQFEWRWKQTSV